METNVQMLHSFDKVVRLLSSDNGNNYKSKMKIEDPNFERSIKCLFFNEWLYMITSIHWKNVIINEVVIFLVILVWLKFFFCNSYYRIFK